MSPHEIRWTGGLVAWCYFKNVQILFVWPRGQKFFLAKLCDVWILGFHSKPFLRFQVQPHRSRAMPCAWWVGITTVKICCAARLTRGWWLATEGVEGAECADMSANMEDRISEVVRISSTRQDMLWYHRFIQILDSISLIWHVKSWFETHAMDDRSRHLFYSLCLVCSGLSWFNSGKIIAVLSSWPSKRSASVLRSRIKNEKLQNGEQNATRDTVQPIRA